MVGKSEVGDQTPWFEFAGVGRLAVVVAGEPLLQIFRNSDVVLLSFVDAFDDIDISHGQ